MRRNKLSRFRRRAPLRHDRHEARRGRGHRRRADLHREGRRAADHRAAASASASRCRRARVPGPHLDGRARHHARRGRPGDLACRSCAMSTPAPRSAPPISSAPARCGAARTARSRRRSRPMPRTRRRRRPSTIELGEERYVEMSAAEQFILTVSENGYGKRSSSYEYRITSRGGKGIVAMAIWKARRAPRPSGQDRPAGRLVPGRGGRPDHAGHRRRPADPHARSTASASPAARRRA